MNLPEFGLQVRRGGVALVLAGMLSLSAACGGGTTETSASPEAGGTPAVTGEVQVTEEVATTTETTPTSEATPSRPAPQVRSVGQVRDPFVNPTTGAAPVPANTPIANNPGPGPNQPDTPSTPMSPTKPEVVVQKPEIKVTGIVRSGGTYRAILTGPENSYIVAAGEKLGAYSVSSITANSVTLTFQNHKFTLPLEQESFGPGGSRATEGGGGASGGPGPGAPGAPPPPGPGPGPR